jgi:hypothetical protein
MTRRNVGRFSLVVVVVLAAAELGVRLLGPHLPEPELYADRSTTVKVAQLGALAETDRCGTVVIAGNSMARDDLVPDRMEDQLPEDVAVYNASLDAASPALLRRWLPDEVLPAAQPDLLIVGLSSFDLNDNARISASAVDSYDGAALTRDDAFGRLQQPLIDRSALFRHRQELRDPQVVWSSIQRLARGERMPRADEAGIPGVLDADGSGLSRRDLVYDPTSSSDLLLRTELLNDYRLGGSQASYLESLARQTASDGIEVVLVALPVTDQYVEAHPGGEADQSAFLEELGDLSNRLGVPFIDAHAWGTERDFADTHHLNGQAADRFSAEMVGRLEGAGVALPPC